jgi:hypothetical protein
MIKYMSKMSRNVIFSENKNPVGMPITSPRGWGGGVVGGVGWGIGGDIGV